MARLPLKFRGSAGSAGQWFVDWPTIAILTLIAAATGGLLGLHLLSTAERMFAERRNAENAQPLASPYAGPTRLRKLAPIVANLAAPEGARVRIEASLIVGDLGEEEAMLLTSRIGEDVLAYVRTVPLAQLEGASGLKYLREDLNERALIRSGGKVRELVIETLVMQ